MQKYNKGFEAQQLEVAQNAGNGFVSAWNKYTVRKIRKKLSDAAAAVRLHYTSSYITPNTRNKGHECCA